MKRFLTLAGLALVVLLGVLGVRAAMFTIDQGPLPSGVALEVEEDATIARFQAALRIETVSRSTDSGEPILDDTTFDTLRAHLKDSFPKLHTALSTETINRHTLLFTWKGRDPKLKPMLVMAHQDVVPVDDADKWTHPPFSGELADGYIWGRGALDVKMGVMGILEAVETLVTQGHQPERTVYLAFGHDEEIGGQRGAKAVAEHLAKQNVRLAFVLDEGGAVVQGVVPGVPGPVALVGVAEKGYVSLKLSAEGTGGHSSMPPPQTAVGVIAQAIHRLESNPFPARMDHAGRFFGYVGPKMPFDKRIIFANLWLFRPLVISILSGTKSMNASLRTTTAATVVRGGVKDNVLPIHAEATVNFRILPGDTPESVKAYVERTIADDRVTVEFSGGFGDAPSPVSSVTSDAFVLIRDTIRATAQDPDLVVAPYLVVGATDSRYFQGIADDVYRFLPTRLGPKDLDRIHGTDERISRDNYLEAVRFYYALVKGGSSG